MKYLDKKLLAFITSFGFAGLVYGVPQELIDGLGDESFQHREASEQKLVEWLKGEGEAGVKGLQEIRKKVVSPERKSRLDKVIADVTRFKAIPNTRGYMGIAMFMHLGGVGVERAMPGTPAAKAGLEAGDIIVTIDGIDLSKMKDAQDQAMNFLSDYVKKKNAGEKLTLQVERGGKLIDKVLKLADYNRHRDRMFFGGLLDEGEVPRMRLNRELLRELDGLQGKNFQLIPDENGRRLLFNFKMDADDMRKLKLQGGGDLELKFKVKPGAGGKGAKPRKFIMPKVEAIPVPEPKELHIPTE